MVPSIRHLSQPNGALNCASQPRLPDAGVASLHRSNTAEAPQRLCATHANADPCIDIAEAPQRFCATQANADPDIERFDSGVALPPPPLGYGERSPHAVQSGHISEFQESLSPPEGIVEQPPPPPALPTPEALPPPPSGRPPIIMHSPPECFDIAADQAATMSQLTEAALESHTSAMGEHRQPPPQHFASLDTNISHFAAPPDLMVLIADFNGDSYGVDYLNVSRGDVVVLSPSEEDDMNWVWVEHKHQDRSETGWVPHDYLQRMSLQESANPQECNRASPLEAEFVRESDVVCSEHPTNPAVGLHRDIANLAVDAPAKSARAMPVPSHADPWHTHGQLDPWGGAPLETLALQHVPCPLASLQASEVAATYEFLGRLPSPVGLVEQTAHSCLSEATDKATGKEKNDRIRELESLLEHALKRADAAEARADAAEAGIRYMESTVHRCLDV